MTPNLTAEAFAALGGPDLVYVRPIKAAEIIASTRTVPSPLPWPANWPRCPCTKAELPPLHGEGGWHEASPRNRHPRACPEDP